MKHHFRKMYVVTTPGSKDAEVAAPYAEVLETNLFTADEAVFAKWRALEAGFDAMGRHGWICNMDADVIWPEKIEWPKELVPGFLCSPLRRMLSLDDFRMADRPPSEESWKHLPIHRNVNEWAGYSQIFHADDPVLGPPPWHQTDWKHAGGADSFFQAKWPREKRIRPNWECLHIGAAGENWFGRTSQRLDGSVPEGREEKLRATAEIWQRRAERRRQGLDQFEPERIRSNDSLQSL